MWKYGKLWAGDTNSYELTLAAVPAALAYQQAGKEMIRSDLLRVEAGVGIITIEGGLIPGEAGFMSYFGLTGYGDIRNAVIEAANHAEVQSILLAINSGGGAVDGCDDCATLIAKVNAEVKPIVTYADGSMGSAAYWLGSQVSSILIGPTTVAGSIGVILKHSEMSKARAAAGITDTVIRSGEFKQLANALEPLTPEAEAELQQMSDDIYAVFRARVAEARGMSTAVVDSKIGKGREFVGQRAVSAGLADGIATYEGALSAAIALHVVDKAVAPRQNTRSTGASMSKKSLTAEQIAAIASGAVIEASAAQETAEATAEDAATAAAAAAEAAKGTDSTATAEATAAAAQAAATAAEATAAAGAAGAAAVQAESDLVKFLRTELSTASAKALTDGIEIAQLKAAATTTAETMPKLLEIARTAVDKMKVALGGSAGAAATMTPLEVIAAHSEASTAFNTKFKVGGAAATSASTDKPAVTPTPAGPPNLHLIAARSAVR